MDKQLKILIVDDDVAFSTSVKQQVEQYGTILVSNSTKEATNLINNEFFDLAFFDLNIDHDLDGLILLEKATLKNIYSIILSGDDDDDFITKAYELGCKDYFSKGDEKNTIHQVITKFLLKKDDTKISNFFKNDFITQNTYLKEQLTFLLENAYSMQPIMLLGPSGSGKTFIVKNIHNFSKVKGKLVEINCSAIPENLLESELFGHQKGAFTGATQSKEGLLKTADNGIVFLDEISSMPISLQSKLLKAIEEKSFTPVGANYSITSNFRIISATCENIIDLIGSANFREDLFHRLSGINITIPPLKDRREDIPLLISHFLKKSSRKIILKDDAKTFLANSNLSGNVRELERIISIISNTDKGIIDLKDIQNIKIPLNNSNEVPSNLLLSKKILKHSLDLGLSKTLKQIQSEIVQSIYSSNNKKVNKTLSDLKISSNTFYSALKQLQQ